jgi:hypothetical protein
MGKLSKHGKMGNLLLVVVIKLVTRVILVLIVMYSEHLRTGQVWLSNAHFHAKQESENRTTIFRMDIFSGFKIMAWDPDTNMSILQMFPVFRHPVHMLTVFCFETIVMVVKLYMVNSCGRTKQFKFNFF